MHDATRAPEAMTVHAVAGVPGGVPPRRLAYSTMSIPLGLAGSGAAWTAAAHRFGLTPAVGETLFVGAALGWLLVVIARAPVTRRRWRELRAEFRDPFAGPFPAYVPIVALLLTTHYAPHVSPEIGQVSAVVWVVMLTLMCGNLIAFWLGGTLRLHHLHPGYSLPVIAGPYIASATLTTVGLSDAGLAAMGAGTFFWLVIGTIIVGRLIIAQPLQTPMSPTLSVIVTPPITGGLAWFAHTGGRIDILQHGLLGVIVLLVAAQLFLVPTFARAPYGIAWWALSFPAGALAGYSIRWDSADRTPASTTVAVAALVAASVVLLALSAASVTQAIRRERHARTSP